MTRINNRWRWVFSLISLILLLIGLDVYLNYYWKPILTSRIKEAVQTSSNGLYHIDFNNISVNFLSGKLKVTDISFKPDSQTYQKMLKDSIAPRHLYRVEVKELVLRHINPIKIYSRGVLEMSAVEIERPVLQVEFNELNNTLDTVKEDPRSAWQRLSPYLNKVSIGEIVFRDANFKYIDRDREHEQVTALSRLQIRVTDLLIDSLSQFDHSRLYHTKDIYAELNGYTNTTLDSNYDVSIKQVQASTSGRYVRIKGFKLDPKFGEMEFSQRFKVQKERYSVNLEEMFLDQIDYRLLNTERKLRAKSLGLKNMKFSIFLNREMPGSGRNSTQNFPVLSLQRFRLNTLIDSIHLSGSTVNYSEFNPDSRRKGTVTFSKINGKIMNVTNDPQSLKKDSVSRVNLTALLMDRGRFNVSMRFDLNSALGAFEFKGDAGRMDADRFNTAIRPLSLILIRSGTLNKLEFQGKGSTRGINGNLTCFYNDLKISLLEKSESTSWLKRKGIASIFANVLIIKSDNPMPGKTARKASFSYKRPEHSSFFNMIWKGMSGALLESIGFDTATQREIQARLRKMEIERDEREERRDERLRKRDARRSNRN